MGPFGLMDAMLGIQRELALKCTVADAQLGAMTMETLLSLCLKGPRHKM